MYEFFKENSFHLSTQREFIRMKISIITWYCSDSRKNNEFNIHLEIFKNIYACLDMIFLILTDKNYKFFLQNQINAEINKKYDFVAIHVIFL